MRSTPPIVDPLLVLAKSIQTTPGTCVALIGSGVSTGAHMKTGWEITRQEE